ncbi:MAG: heavy metal translocating P-type ATPase metal-binding domain-containing protein, partial [Cyclobacteriaceae bacterium]|nr:heavy metal translocating P-type ATPase metal-binding domain-containing protein [Cyclobacteriaceae bacterium]
MTETIQAKQSDVKCYHCGEACEENIHSDDKVFCCTGCKTVYDLLSEHDLSEYYRYEQSPGKKNVERSEYLYLENTKIAEQLLDFSSDNFSKITFYIPDIHCSSCIWLLENLEQIDKGIINSRVQFVKKQLEVSFNPTEISLRKIAEILSDVGYPPLISYEGSIKGKKNTLTSIYVKLGVAAFCFGNIMLLSFPEYLGFHPSFEFQEFFTYLNLILSIPVAFYSGSGYLKAAFKSVSNGYLNLDVPISLGILTLFFRSTYEVLAGTGPGFFDSLSGFIFFLLIGKWFQEKTYESLSFERDFKSYFPLAVLQDTAKGQLPVPVADLKQGDSIFIRNNEIIPVDAELLSTTANIDFSFVTGEEVPVVKHKGDLIYAGGRQKGTGILLKVLKPVSQGYLTSLWNSGPVKENSDRSFEKTIDKVGRYFTWIILFIAIGTAIAWAFISPGRIWEIVTAVLIVACPCALALSVPFTYGNIIRLAGKNGLYLKSSDIIERFNKVTAIVFDKTGTLTNTRGGTVLFEGNRDSSTLKIIKAMARNSVHPYSKKIVEYLKKVPDLELNGQIAEYPGQGLQLYEKGSLYKLGSSAFTGNNDMVVAGTGTRVYFSANDVYLGHFEIKAEYREGIGRMMQILHQKFSLFLLSGDNNAEENVLRKHFADWKEIHFNLGPDEKMRFVDTLQKKMPVLMIGDGLNDAGALKI